MVVSWRMAIYCPLIEQFPFTVEVQDDELLDTFVSRCWFESYDDTDQDGIPDESEYGESLPAGGAKERLTC